MNDATQGVRPPELSAQGSDPHAPTREDIQAFVQTKTYYFLPKWDALDPTLRRRTSGTFNWTAFFLGHFWMAYRKMYLYAVICAAFLFVFGSIMRSINIPQSAYGVAIMFIFGRYGSSLYRRHVEIKIRQIKTTMAPEYWTQALRDKGGTSMWAVIPFFAWYLLTFYIMFWSMEGR